MMNVHFTYFFVVVKSGHGSLTEMTLIYFNAYLTVGQLEKIRTYGLGGDVSLRADCEVSKAPTPQAQYLFVCCCAGCLWTGQSSRAPLVGRKMLDFIISLTLSM